MINDIIKLHYQLASVDRFKERKQRLSLLGGKVVVFGNKGIAEKIVELLLVKKIF